MKIRIKKLLEIRKEPSLTADSFMTLAPDSLVTVDGNLYSGEELDGSDQWYKDQDGNYYPESFVEVENELVEDPAGIDIIQQQEFDPFSLYDGDGSEIGIAIFDSGVNKDHPYLKNRIKYYNEVFPGSDEIHLHGHKLAGILASDDPNVSRNKSNIYCFRVSDSYNFIDDDILLEKIGFLANNEDLRSSIDVINLSIEVGDQNYYLPKIQAFVDKMTTIGIVSVVSAGNNFKTISTSGLENVIKVGSFNEVALDKLINGQLTNPYDYCFYNKPIGSYPLNEITLSESIKDVSAYTAFLSSIIARIIKTNNIEKNAQRNDFVRNQLDAMSSSISNDYKPYKIYKK